MHVNDALEPWPEEHVCAVDVAVNGRHFAALQLESEVLVQTNAGEQPSHASAAAAAVQTDRHGAAAREGDRETFTSLRHTGQHAREVATYAAISCGWSASRGSRPSPLPQAAHRAGHTPQRPGNRSNCRQTQYRGGRACLQGRRRSLLHR